jgi:hypothetical protein
MSSRNMCLLPRATLHSDSEQLQNDTDIHINSLHPFLAFTHTFTQLPSHAIGLKGLAETAFFCRAQEFLFLFKGLTINIEFTWTVRPKGGHGCVLRMLTKILGITQHGA